MWNFDWHAWGLGHPDWVLAAIFLTAFLESLAVIGLVVPGVMMLFIFTGVASWINIDVAKVMLCGFSGAVLGDWISFYLGRTYRYSLRRWRIVQAHIHWLDRGEQFFYRWGWMSLLIGRFVGPVRPLMPMVAGAFFMRSSSFLFISFFASLLWVPIYLLPGYFSGEWLSQLSSEIESVWLLVVFIVLVSFSVLMLLERNDLSRVTSVWLFSGFWLVLSVLLISLNEHPFILESRSQWLGEKLDQEGLFSWLRLMSLLANTGVVTVFSLLTALLCWHSLRLSFVVRWLLQVGLALLLSVCLQKGYSAWVNPEQAMLLELRTLMTSHSSGLLTLVAGGLYVWIDWPRLIFFTVFKFGLLLVVVAGAVSSSFLGHVPLGQTSIGLGLSCFQVMLAQRYLFDDKGQSETWMQAKILALALGVCAVVTVLLAALL